MHPPKHGLVLAADVGSAGGGVEAAGGDQVQRLETLAAAGVGGLQRGQTQVLKGLPPLGQLHVDHRTAPRLLLVGSFTPPTLSAGPGTKTPGLNRTRV